MGGRNRRLSCRSKPLDTVEPIVGKRLTRGQHRRTFRSPRERRKKETPPCPIPSGPSSSPATKAKKQSVDFVDMREDELMEGDVTVAVEATTVNYKDGLAITGMAPVVRRWPLVPGIDFAGTVISSRPCRLERAATRSFSMAGASAKTHHGAYAARARVKGRTGWCRCPHRCHPATRWLSARQATRRCCA